VGWRRRSSVRDRSFLFRTRRCGLLANVFLQFQRGGAGADQPAFIDFLGLHVWGTRKKRVITPLKVRPAPRRPTLAQNAVTVQVKYYFTCPARLIGTYIEGTLAHSSPPPSLRLQWCPDLQAGFLNKIAEVSFFLFIKAPANCVTGSNCI
jgi:hypothetical protein